MKGERKMHDKNYSSEVSLKKWANAFFITATVVLVLSILAAFVIFCIDFEEFWWISLIIGGSGALLFASLSFSGHLTWGFAEIIGNTRKTAVASGMETSAPVVNDELPEL